MPATKAVTKRYYPALSEVITVDDLPEFLHFAEEGMNFLLDRIHYKNLQYSKSYRGDAAFYSLDIVTRNIGIDLPFGLRFVLNPDEDGDPTISSFPISLEYQWEVLAFLRSFNLQGFSFTPDAFFELGLKIFRISQEQVIAQTLNYFIDPEDNISKFQHLVNDINGLYPAANLTLPVGQEPTVGTLTDMINQNPEIPKNVPELMFAIYILDSDLSVTKDRLHKFYALMVPEGIEGYIRKMLEPKVKATLKLSAAIEFPNSVLKPVHADGTPIPGAKTLFKFAEATFYADTESGIGAELELAGSLIPEYSQIGNTGLVIGFTGAKLDLSRKTNIPEADAAGYPVDFMGLYVKHATIAFNRFGKDDPNRASASIRADNLLIGTGGVSGRIALEANGVLYRKFGDFAVELNTFSLTFRQNSIIGSDISGKLTIGGFKEGAKPAVIGIQAHIQDNGDFSITALPQPGLFTITLPNVLELEIRSLSLGKQDRGFYIEVAGKLNFIADLPVLGKVLPQGIDINKLRIWDNGDLEFHGGGFAVPQSFRLNVGPVKLEVNHIALGAIDRKLHNIDRKYRYFGFDGMVNTGRAGINTTGNGIKFYFTTDNNETDKPFDSFISIDRLAIDMTIPGNVDRDEAIFLLNGYLSVSNPDPTISGSNAKSEYSGAVSFSMPRLRLAGSAGMRLKPDVPSFLVDVGLELSTPIPLGGTGLGIYGFRGLVGQHYVVSKSATTPPLPESASWWEYYKAKSTRTGREGIEIDKFADGPGYALGLGLSIATAFDSGKIFSSKLFLFLGMPDLLIIEGQAGILRSRIGLDEQVDPPFSALVVISKQSFTGTFGVNYRLPEGGSFDGNLFSLNGTLDMAFFFNNASGWYLNVGKDQPESARVRARILTLFQGYAYLMISARGFRAGAGARFDFNKRFGPVAVGLGASIDMGGWLSFKPVQIGAFIQLGGYAYLKVWFIRLGISVQVGLAVEAPHPFNITGWIEIKIKLPWPIKNIKFRLDISWYINNNDAPLKLPLPVLQLPDPAHGYIPAAAVNILSNESFQINYLNYETTGNTINIPAPGASGWQYNFNDPIDVTKVTIPLDSFIDIELLKPVKPDLPKLGGAGNQLPEGYWELMPPQRGLSNQVKHEFHLTGLDIFAWKETGPGAGTWVPYNIYEAVTAIKADNTGPGAIDLSGLKVGYWQFATPNRYNKIRLLSQNMFSYSNQKTSASSDLDGLNFRRKDLFCYESITKETVINWKSEALDTLYPDGSTNLFKGESFKFDHLEAKVKINAITGAKGLFIETSGGGLQIKLSKAVTYLKLNFGPNENNIRIDFLGKTYKRRLFGYAIAQEVMMNPAFLTRAQQNTEIIYNDLNNPIDQLLIQFGKYRSVDFDGDLVVGGYFALPKQYLNGNGSVKVHEAEMEKGLMYASLFNKSFSEQEVLAEEYSNMQGVVGRWALDSTLDLTGKRPGVFTGSADPIPGFYKKDDAQKEQLHQVFSYAANADAFRIPSIPEIKVEPGSFAFELTAIFDPFVTGVSTLLYKVKEDSSTGFKKGFALHLCQDVANDKDTTYANNASIPSFGIWFTCYEDLESSGIKATGQYTLDCATSKLLDKQYKHLLVSVNRATGKVDIFIDRLLKVSVPIPLELDLVNTKTSLTCINQLSYLSEGLQRRQEENGVTKDKLINEIQLINDNLNKTIQPVWRPSTTYAISLRTRDVVNGNVAGATEKSHVFGFRTAGPIGHFQQHSFAYQELLKQDRGGEFKLSNLKSYIDYERSSPDAQSRYDLSKPVFYHHPKVNLLFTKPYINAMFADWDSYNGLPAIKSSLQIQVFDPFGVPVSPELVWEQLPDIPINFDNWGALPPDQQILFLMNLSASDDSCNELPITIKKRTKRGTYQLPDLQANRLYTALFNAVYQPNGEVEQKTEVHKFSFKTSRFNSFQEQAKSFVLKDTVGAEEYAIFNTHVAFKPTEIEQNLKVLIDNDNENDPVAVQRYAVKFDRLVYGGLALKNLEPIEGSVINLVINTDPETPANKRILGILIRNPEPFNDPKLPVELLADTVQMLLTKQDQTALDPTQFIYIHSRDTSAVFITNAEMDIPVGSVQLGFRYKLFNGKDYLTEHEDYSSPAIPINIGV